MSDRLARTLLPDDGVVLVGCVSTGLSRHARGVHGLASSSAALLAQGLTAAAMMAAFQKAAKVDLHVSGNGPAGTLFADADPEGNVRGYVRNGTLALSPGERFASAPLLGASGLVSVVRDVEGRFYRGIVPLTGAELEREIELYFGASEQVEAAVGLEVLSAGDEALGWVGGVLAQRLPDGDSAAIERLRERLRGGRLRDAAQGGQASPFALCEAIAEGDRLELLADQPVNFACPCSRERVLRALSTISPADLQEMIDEDHGAEATCDFCMSRYEITEAELLALVARLTHPSGEEGAA